MNQDQHDGVSSDGGSGTDNPMGGSSVPAGEADQHESVGGEGIELSEELEANAEPDLVEEDFQGAFEPGEIEEVASFDPSRANAEGMESALSLHIEEDVPPPNCALDFSEPESVCGHDDRVRIKNTTRVPWRWNCQLIITRADGSRSRCTGWFIGPGTVMTAGHCVFSHSAGGWARRIEVVPGMNANQRPYGSQVGTAFRSVRGWTVNRKPDYDYGAVILPNGNLGKRVGWFGFASLSKKSLNKLKVNNAGYPGDKPYGTQWFNAGRISRVTNRRIYYMIDTYGGQSGSPVWRLRDGKRHAVGIHAYGGCPNKATRITKPVFNNMLRWKRERS